MVCASAFASGFNRFHLFCRRHWNCGGFFVGKARVLGQRASRFDFNFTADFAAHRDGFYLIVLLGRNGLIGFYLYEWFGWQITFTWIAAVIAAAVMALPLMIKTSRAAIESVDSQFESAARNLGYGEFQTFFRVTLPLAKKGVIAGAVLSFARALGEFGATLMFAGNIAGKTQTTPLAIYEAVFAGDDGRAQILALVLTGISIAAVYLTNKLTNGKLYNR